MPHILTVTATVGALQLFASVRGASPWLCGFSSSHFYLVPNQCLLKEASVSYVITAAVCHVNISII